MEQGCAHANLVLLWHRLAIWKQMDANVSLYGWFNRLIALYPISLVGTSLQFNSPLLVAQGALKTCPKNIGHSHGDQCCVIPF